MTENTTPISSSGSPPGEAYPPWFDIDEARAAQHHDALHSGEPWEPWEPDDEPHDVDVDRIFAELADRIRLGTVPGDFPADAQRYYTALDLPPTSNTPSTAIPAHSTGGSDLRGDDRWPQAIAADSANALLDALDDNEKLVNQQSAHKVLLVNAIRHRIEADTGICLDPERGPKTKPTPGWTEDVIQRSQLVLDAAVILKISEGATQILFHQCRLLEEHLPATFTALQEGAISFRHATVIAEEADSLPVEARTAFDADMAPRARQMTAVQLGRKARAVREKMHPESIRERHVRAAADRRVCVEPARDGMARLELLMPAPEAFGIFNRLDDTAQALAGPAEPRTLDQLRADVATDLLLNGQHRTTEPTSTNPTHAGPIHADPDNSTDSTHQFPQGIVPTVMVVVPVLTLLGLSEEPATLEGYGPIDAETARELAGNAKSWFRILTHPETGTVLSVGQTSYKVPEAMRRYLQYRDGTCRAWGCNRQARNCDLDHTVEWHNGGHTAVDNLAHLCERHHKLKTHTGWDVEQVGDGRLQWTSPLGRAHRTEPANVVGGLDRLIPVRATDPVAAPAAPEIVPQNRPE
jgi:hypothetical protein